MGGGDRKGWDGMGSGGINGIIWGGVEGGEGRGAVTKGGGERDVWHSVFGVMVVGSRLFLGD